MDPIELAENQTRHFTSEVLSKGELLAKTRQLYVGIVDSLGKEYRLPLHNEAYDLIENGAEHRV